MRDKDKTQEQLIKEVTELRQRIIELERVETERKQAERALRESEEELEAIFNEVRDGIVLLDLTGKIIKINKRIPEVTGYSEKYIIGKRFDFFKNFTSKSIAKMIPAFSKVVAGYQVPSFEVIGYTKTGEKRIGEIYGSLLKKKGKAVGVLVVMTDITERKQAEEARRESEGHYRTLIDNIDLGITLMDVYHNIIMVNAAQSAKFNKPVSEIIGKKCFREFEKRDAVCPHCPGVQTMATNRPVQVETEGVRDDGSRFQVRLKTFPISDQDGTAIGFVETAVDISKRKQAEDALRESEERYRTLIDNIALGINLIDADHNILMVNAQMGEKYNKPVSEIIGKKCFLEFEKRDAVCPHCPGVQTITTGKFAEVETVGVRDDGSCFHVRLQTFPVVGPDGRVTAFIEIAEDITERKQMENAMRDSEQKYRTILETMEEGYYETDLAGNFTFFNETTCRHHGRSRDELLGMNYREYASAEAAKKIYPIFNKVYRKGMPARVVDYEVIRKDGSKKFIEISVSLLRDASGEPIGFCGVSRDRTEQKKAEGGLRQSEEKYRTILENIEEGYYEVDLTGNFTFFNDSLCMMLRYTRDEMMGMNNREYMDEKTFKRVYKIFNTVFRTGKSTTIHDWQIIRKGKSKRFIEASISLIRDAGGNPTGFRGVVRDITERKLAQEELEFIATHDSLTSLPNRTLFNDRLALALAQAHRYKKKLAVMLLDLDYFKDINDTMGHGIGDQLLRVVGNRLTELLRGGDTVARAGGDEFLLLLSEIASIKDANTIAQKILEAFRKPFVLDDHEIMITTSIGIAIYPDDSDDASTLMKHADVAMYRAKDKGRDNFQRYTPA
jgi:diguanylate cyclase (GGDEF)-like protein/PAS domain S-box-containing protein